MRALRTVTLLAAGGALLTLYALNFPTRATLFGLATASWIALLAPLVPFGLMVTGAVKHSLRWGLGGAAGATLLAGAARVPTLTAGTVLFVLSLLLYVETLTAAHRLAGFERDAGGPGADAGPDSAEAARQYLRFARWPLLLTGLLTVAALLAHLALRLPAAPPLYSESLELTSAYGVTLVGLATLAVFALLALLKGLLSARRA